jgi:hypothetical protein
MSFDRPTKIVLRRSIESTPHRPVAQDGDEVIGKLHSLATEDFRSLAGLRLALEKLDDNDFGSLLFLFARLWAQIEIIRQEGLSIALTTDPRNARLQSFLS